MRLYVMDTDIVGFALQQHPKVLQRIRTLPDDDLIVTTIITFGEDLAVGYPPVVARRMASPAHALTLGCSAGLISTRGWCACHSTLFDELRGQRLRIGTNDVAIAAITLSVGGVLLTRNYLDFERIPNLLLEDWTG